MDDRSLLAELETAIASHGLSRVQIQVYHFQEYRDQAWAHIFHTLSPEIKLKLISASIYWCWLDQFEQICPVFKWSDRCPLSQDELSELLATLNVFADVQFVWISDCVGCTYQTRRYRLVDGQWCSAIVY